MTSTLQPRRIKEARLFRGLTQNDLAGAVGITKQAVSQFETGVLTPKADTLLQISEVLEFPLSFFSHPFADPILTPVFFRKRKMATKKSRDVFQTYIEWMSEIYEYIEGYIRMPEVRLITKEKVGYTPADLSRIATELRRFWGLGDGPITNMMLLLENNGFIISKTGLDAKKVDACSVFYTSTKTSKRPMIFLTSGTSSVRSRRDLAHELGHQVLHSWMDKDEFEENKDIIEQDAETFASYFLMPEQAMRRECYAVKSLDALLMMKTRWGTSAQSILYHLINIGCMDQELGERLLRSMYRKGWRSHEPGDDEIPHEMPGLIKDALTMLIDNKIKTREEILDELSLPASDICDLCGFSRTFFDVHPQRPTLTLIKGKSCV